MVARNLSFAAFVVSLASCTNDYDQFDFGQGAGGSTSANPNGGASSTGGNPSTGGSPSSGGSASEGGGGSSSTTSANGGGGNGVGGMGGNGQGGQGGSPVTDTVPCGPPTECDLDAGEVCCLDTGNDSVSCVLAADCGDAPLGCNGPQDCAPNQDCCFDVDMGDVAQTECRSNCMGSDLLCDPAIDPGTCPVGDDCVDSAQLPDGYSVCN